MQREIVQSVGNNRMLTRKMSFLMNVLGRNPHIQWDDRGTVAIGGNIIPGSNNVDLLNDVLRDRRSSAPIGWERFSRLLVFSTYRENLYITINVGIIFKDCMEHKVKSVTEAIV
jgi:hypothetical protein